MAALPCGSIMLIARHELFSKILLKTCAEDPAPVKTTTPESLRSVQVLLRKTLLLTTAEAENPLTPTATPAAQTLSSKMFPDTTFPPPVSSTPSPESANVKPLTVPPGPIRTAGGFWSGGRKFPTSIVLPGPATLPHVLLF